MRCNLATCFRRACFFENFSRLLLTGSSVSPRSNKHLNPTEKMNVSRNNPVYKLLRIVSNVEANEVRALMGSFLFVVVLMSAYYILRPVRDAMASDWTDAEVSWLWTLNFFISTAAVALYGALVSHFRLASGAGYLRHLCADVLIIFRFSRHYGRSNSGR